MIDKITSISDLDKAISLSDSFFVVIFKHSNSCSVSASRLRVFEEFVSRHSDVKSFLVVVQENRDVCDEIVSRFGVKHESPQVLFFRAGKVVWSDSHFGILLDALENVVA